MRLPRGGKPRLNFDDRDEMMAQLNGIRALHGRDARNAMSKSEEFMEAFHGVEIPPYMARQLTGEDG